MPTEDIYIDKVVVDGSNETKETVKLSTQAQKFRDDLGWSPPSINIGSFFGNGASALANPNAGMQWTFDASSDDEILIQICLDCGMVVYDGGDLALVLDWQAFTSAPGAGDNVKWEVDYVFLKNDGTEDADSKSATNNVDSIDISARDANKCYSDQLTDMIGVAGTRFLNITLRRNSQGGGADTYSNAADLFNIEIKKV